MATQTPVPDTDDSSFLSVDSGLEEELSESTGKFTGSLHGGQPRTKEPDDPHALQVVRHGAWEHAKGASLIEHSTMMRNSFGLPEDLPEVRSKELEEQIDTASLRLADFYAACYLPEPELLEKPHDQMAKEFLQETMTAKEFADIKEVTTLDSVCSDLACLSIADGYRQYVEARKKEDDQDTQGGDGKGEKKPGGQDASKAIAQAAAAQASKDVADYKDIQAQIAGTQDGDNSKISGEEIRTLLQAAKKDPGIRKICELAGRYVSIANTQQKLKSREGMDDVSGTDLGCDLSKTLPHELGKLKHPLMKYDFLRRLSERHVMQREHFGIETKARGPIMVFIDESGSMSGNPLMTAKAIALALYWVARHQGRWCCLSGFASANQLYTEVFHKSSPNGKGLSNFIHHRYGGGTSFGFMAPERLDGIYSSTGADKGKTDIIVITDGCGSSGWQDRFMAWKAKHKCVLRCLAIGSADGGDFRTVADEVHQMASLSESEQGVISSLGL